MTYEQKLGRRKTLSQRDLESLGIEKRRLPIPRLLTDELYQHEQSAEKSSGFISTLLPFEKPGASRFILKEDKKQIKFTVEPVKKYNHFEMNYTGWNR